MRRMGRFWLWLEDHGWALANAILACTILAGLALLLAGCGRNSVTGPSLSPAPAARVILPPLPPVPADHMFGYYSYGAMNAGCGWTNWVLFSVPTQSVERARELAEDARRCRQVVSYATSGPWKHWQDTFRPIAQAFADAGVLHSVYVADEPMANPVGNPNRVEYAALAQRIADVHAAGFKAMFTEYCSAVDAPHPAVDYYGVDCYGGRPVSMGRVFSAHPEVNVLVGPAYGGMPYPDQNAWYGQAKKARVGLVFWMWPTCGGWTGTEDMPEVQEQHRSLWARW